MLGAVSGAVAAMASSSPEEAERVSRSISAHEATATDRSTPAALRPFCPNRSRAKKPRANAARTATAQRVTAKATTAASVAPRQAERQVGVDAGEPGRAARIVGPRQAPGQQPHTGADPRPQHTEPGRSQRPGSGGQPARVEPRRRR